MFGFLFRWRKASKCKKAIKQLQCRLKLLKNKRSSIVRLLREDIAELVRIGHEETALNRAEQLFQDENTMGVYELLENFCEFIRMNISYIQKRKDIPNDVNEAVSSLVFASSRCGELPELRLIRKLFEERYGQRFAVDTAELHPGNLVNFQIKERLCITSVPVYVKHQLVDEIAKGYCLQAEILSLDYDSELQQALENSIHQERHREASNAFKLQEILVDSSFLHSPKSFDAVSGSFSSSLVHKFSPVINQANEVEKVAHLVDSEFGFKGSGGDHTKERQINGRSSTTSSSESLPQIQEERMVYLDDIEEFRSSMEKDVADCQDQRLFKFKQSVLPNSETVDGLCSEKSGSKSVKASGKQQRRRSLYGVKDVECEMYYEKPCKSPANKLSYHPRKQQKKSVVESGDLHIRSCCHCHFSPKMNDCSLDHSYYCCIDDGDKEQEFQHRQLQMGSRKPERSPTNDLRHRHSFQYRGSEESEKPSVPQEQRRRSYDSGASEYNVFTYSSQNAQENPCLAGKKPKPPYLTVKTMPPERSKENWTEKDKIPRCSSFPCQYPDHVHPKLPDYEDIAAKFLALKKERLQNIYKC